MAQTASKPAKKISKAVKRTVVVGCGAMGKAWMKTIRDNPRVELIGVVDLRREAAEAAAQEFGLPPERAFTDVKSAIAACTPDFICDITIPEAHCQTTVAALGLGVPVIGEKPRAASMAEGVKMVKAAATAGLTSMVSQSRRYDPKHVAIRDVVSKGTLGEVTTINCDFYIGAHFGGFRDTMESPLILDMAIHHFDLARFFFDSDPVSVYCQEFNPKGSWYKGDVAATAIFELASGAIFTFRGSWCAEGLHTSWNGDWRIIGTKGTLVYVLDQAPQMATLKPGGKPGFHREMTAITLADAKINGGGIVGALNEFLDHLIKGTPVQCETKDNLKSLAMVFAAMKSSRSGKRERVIW